MHAVRFLWAVETQVAAGGYYADIQLWDLVQCTPSSIIEYGDNTTVNRQQRRRSHIIRWDLALNLQLCTTDIEMEMWRHELGRLLQLEPFTFTRWKVPLSSLQHSSHVLGGF